MVGFGSCLVLGLVRGSRLEVHWGLGVLAVLGLCPSPCPGFVARYVVGGHPVLLDHPHGFFERLAFLELLFRNDVVLLVLSRVL